MNDVQLKATLKSGKVGKYKVDTGLYFRVTEQQSAFWVLRYSINGKRREITLGRYGKPPAGITLSEARLKKPLRQEHKLKKEQTLSLSEREINYLNSIRLIM